MTRGPPQDKTTYCRRARGCGFSDHQIGKLSLKLPSSLVRKFEASPWLGKPPPLPTFLPALLPACLRETSPAENEGLVHVQGLDHSQEDLQPKTGGRVGSKRRTNKTNKQTSKQANKHALRSDSFAISAPHENCRDGAVRVPEEKVAGLQRQRLGFRGSSRDAERAAQDIAPLSSRGKLHVTVLAKGFPLLAHNTTVSKQDQQSSRLGTCNEFHLSANRGANHAVGEWGTKPEADRPFKTHKYGDK